MIIIKYLYLFKIIALLYMKIIYIIKIYLENDRKKL